MDRRPRRLVIHLLAVVGLCLFLSGCALFERSASCAARKLIAPDILKLQSEDDSPNFCSYHQTLASIYAPYAILSLNAYLPPAVPDGIVPASVQSCVDSTHKAMCPAGWDPDRVDPDDPKSAAIKLDAGGLYMEAFVHTTELLTPREKLEYVIAFRGTEPSDWQDWRANLRWLLPFWRNTDQYPEARRTAVKWIARGCRRALKARTDLRIVMTGHSLGGGLAQGAAYAIERALPPAMTKEQLAGESTQSEDERAAQTLLAQECKGLENRVQVAAVVFDPSPVTGYSDGQKLADCENARSRACRMPIVVRIYESGEVLAPVRRFLSWFYPVSLNVCEDRFDFGRGLPVTQHQMRRIATGLIRTGAVIGNQDSARIFKHHCEQNDGVLLCQTLAPKTCPEGTR